MNDMKKSMKLFCSSPLNILIFGLTLLSAKTVDADTLRVGLFNIPPQISHIEDEKPQGAAVDYFRVIAQRMNLEDYVFEGYPLSRLIRNLEKGEIDVALFLAKNDERASKFQYPKLPFIQLKPSLVVNASSPLTEISSSKDLSGQKVGIIHSSYISPILVDPSIHKVGMSGAGAPKRSLKKLLAKRLDAVFLPESTIRYEIDQLQQKANFKILALEGPTLPIYTVFSSKVPKDIIRRYESAIQEGDHKIYEEFITNYLATH